MDWRTLNLESKEHVGILSLRNPPANALSQAMVGELIQAAEAVTAEESLRVLIITGAGEQYFCSGADVGELGHMSADDFEHWLDLNQQLFNSISNLSLPTIAALNGHCLGGGLELALACDLRAAKVGARLGFPEASRGMLPGSGGTQWLTRLAGPGVANDLILTGRAVQAEEALRLGIINYVVPNESWPRGVEALAQRIGNNAPLAVQWAKRCIAQALRMPLEEGLAFERWANLTCFNTEDLQEGLAASQERRRPTFHGR
jgi:methylglutaconyl-CoA hydratase